MIARDLTRKPKHGPRVCPGCGTCYNRFRCPVPTFAQVKSHLWTSSENPTKWRYKRRHSVLGYWRQLKTSYWNHHIDWCKEQA